MKITGAVQSSLVARGGAMSNSEPAEKKLKTGEDCIVVSASSRYGCKVALKFNFYACEPCAWVHVHAC